MRIAEQVSITITGDCSGPFEKGKPYLLDVEEFHPYEPSAYVWTPGWGCAIEIRGITHWFFIDEAGSVWYNGPEDSSVNEQCGICPAQEAEYNKMLEREQEFEITCGPGWPD